ncbi:MAG: nucleoside deaminase [Chlorobiaceae bacterium]
MKNIFDPELIVPLWLERFCRRNSAPLLSDEERMKFAIELGRQNIIHKTGGPFGAAVFERASGGLVAAGVNLVEGSNCSHAHAEMVALAVAEHRLGSYSLNRQGLPECELVSSCEPCAMCFGALIWSGVTRLVSGATSRDAVDAGFDEGPKPDAWPEELERRGVEVAQEVLRDEARTLFREYLEGGGTLYNGRPASR